MSHGFFFRFFIYFSKVGICYYRCYCEYKRLIIEPRWIESSLFCTFMAIYKVAFFTSQISSLVTTENKKYEQNGIAQRSQAIAYALCSLFASWRHPCSLSHLLHVQRGFPNIYPCVRDAVKHSRNCAIGFYNRYQLCRRFDRIDWFSLHNVDRFLFSRENERAFHKTAAELRTMWVVCDFQLFYYLDLCTFFQSWKRRIH